MAQYILGGRYVSGTKSGFTDQGSGASDALVTCYAELPTDRVWWRLGDLAANAYDTPFPGQVLVICAHPDYRGTPIAAPAFYQYTWGRLGGGGTGHVAMASWAAAAPPGFVALSSLFGPHEQPDPGAIQQGCVIPSCVVPAANLVQIWNDHGSGASDDGSIWGVDDGSGAAWKYNYAVSGYDPPGTAFQLNMAIVEMI
jgi:hypothetical protein